MPVQEDDRRPGAAVAYEDLAVVEVDDTGLEAFEHGSIIAQTDGGGRPPRGGLP
ncbi:MAG: hypothetical protein PV358_15585 [Acidimicrobiales bacterium]|nr:hypothetical protein [Acidimicrobiales bacterium]